MNYDARLMTDKELVKQLAPKYEYVDTFKRKRDHPVFLLEKNNIKYVLKVHEKEIGVQYLNNELISLDRLYGYERIPEIEEEIRGNLGYNGLIKTYISGITLWDLVWSNKLSQDKLKSLRKQARHRLSNMHSKEVYNLDTRKEANFLVSNNYSFIGFFDFDISSFQKDKDVIQNDRNDLETTFNRAILKSKHSFYY